MINQAQAIVFPAPHQVEIQSYDLPSLRPNEILVRTEFSGVSQGTEIWALTGKRNELQFPTVPGYQSVGIVQQKGPEASGMEVGQRVLLSATRLPETYPPTWMATHVSRAIASMDDERPPIPVPDGIDLRAASLAALPAVSLRGIEMLHINPGDLVLVTGQGLIGQASAQLARQRGATVIVSDVNDTRLKLSLETGATAAVNVMKQNLAEAVFALKPGGADVIIETTGRSEEFASCIALLRPQGQLLLQGWYPRPITFDFDTTHHKRPTIAITCGYDVQGVAASMDMMVRGELNFGALISHCVPFTDSPSMYEAMLNGDASVLGVVFDWSGAA